MDTPIVVSSRSVLFFGWVDEVINLMDDVADEASAYVSLAETFGGAPGDVVDRGLMESHPDDVFHWSFRTRRGSG